MLRLACLCYEFQLGLRTVYFLSTTVNILYYPSVSLLKKLSIHIYLLGWCLQLQIKKKSRQPFVFVIRKQRILRLLNKTFLQMFNSSFQNYMSYNQLLFHVLLNQCVFKFPIFPQRNCIKSRSQYFHLLLYYHTIERKSDVMGLIKAKKISIAIFILLPSSKTLPF